MRSIFGLMLVVAFAILGGQDALAGRTQILYNTNDVTAQVAGGSRTPEVCDQTVRVGVQGLQDIPTLLPGC